MLPLGPGAHPREDSTIDRITPYSIWVGHAGDGGDSARLHDLGIEAIVQVAAEETPLTPPRSLVYHRISLLDGPGNPPPIIAAALAWVEQSSADLALRRVGELHPVDVSPGLWREVRQVDPRLWCETFRP